MKSGNIRRWCVELFGEARCGALSLFAGLLVVCVALSVLVPEDAEAQVRERQYVFALDDSGSMGNPIYTARTGGNDPYRMSRFAVRALLGALPDDEVAATIITMSNNGVDTARGAPVVNVPPLRLLRENRARLNALLNAPAAGERGAFTSHDLANTPCQRVLDGIAHQLNEAYRPGVIQTAIYLSDGRCTDGTGKRAIEDFKNNLKSEQAALKAEAENAEGARAFQFYFICMGNEVCSTDFEKLAEETGGASYTAKSAAREPQPEELLRIFGQTIGRSLDLCPSEHVSTTPSEIQSYPGALFTQLVAVPGRGESLEWAPHQVTDPKEGEHHWDGEVFRFYTATLPAGHAPMRPPFGSANASRWRLLAIPYYRELRPVVRVLRGECSNHEGDRREGPHVIIDILPVGGTVCAELLIEGENGAVLRRGGLGREVTPSLQTKHGEKRETVHLRRALGTTQERFLFQLPSIVEGTWTFAGEVELAKECLGPTQFAASGGASTTRRARPLSYVARGVDFGIDIEGASDVLALEPRMREPRTFSWRGNFEPGSEAEMWRGDASPNSDDPYACVRVKYGSKLVGHGPENAVRLNAESGKNEVLTVEVGADCRWKDDPSERSLPIQVRLSGVGDASVTTLRYVLSNKLILGDDEVSVEIAPGGEASVPWGPRIPSGGTRQFSLTVDRAATVPAWPAGLEMDVLTVADAREHKTLRRKKHRETELTFGVSDQHTDQPLVMHLRASSCCNSGEYRVPVRLTQMTDDGHTGETRTQFLVVRVSEGSWIACWLPCILCALFLLFLLFLLVVSYRLIKHTVLVDDRGKNTLQAFTLTLGARRTVLERDDSPQSLLDGRRSPIGGRFSRKLRLMRDGFGSAVRRKDWFETFKYTIGEGLISTPPKYVQGLGGLSRIRAAGSASDGHVLRAGLYLCAEGKGRPALWIVDPESLSFVLTTADEEAMVLRDLQDGRKRDEDDDDSSAPGAIRIRRHVLLALGLRSRSPGDSVGFEVLG